MFGSREEILEGFFFWVGWWVVYINVVDEIILLFIFDSFVVDSFEGFFGSWYDGRFDVIVFIFGVFIFGCRCFGGGIEYNLVNMVKVFVGVGVV